MAYFFGCALPVCGPWYAATWAGAVAGAAIPEALALDFAVPVTFIALVAPGLRTLPNLAAAVGLGGGGAGAELDAVQPLAAGRRRRGDADRRVGRDLAGAAAMSEAARIWTVIVVARRRHLPDPLLVHRPGRRPAAAGLGDAAAALRADGGDARPRGAAGRLAAGDRRRARSGAAPRRVGRARRSAPPRAACSAPSSAAWARSIWAVGGALGASRSGRPGAAGRPGRCRGLLSP